MTKDARVGLVEGEPAIVVTPRGRLATVMTFEIGRDRISAIPIVTDPDRLSGLNLA